MPISPRRTGSDMAVRLANLRGRAALLLGEAAVGHAAPERAPEICAGRTERPVTFIGGDMRVLTSNCGAGAATSLEEYRSRGGYLGLQKALAMAPGEVIGAIKAAGLVGRGGAAFRRRASWSLM